MIKTWEELKFFYEKFVYGYCMCSFVDNIFIIGGRYDCFNGKNDVRRSCVVFDTTTKNWKEVAEMNDYRFNAARTVFEGRVVIFGGANDNGFSRSVEAYDHVADTWSYMSNMIHGSYDHNLLAVSNKLFALGCGGNWDICEVYDSISKEFVVINSHPTFFDGREDQATSIGRNILVFKIFSKKVAIC